MKTEVFGMSVEYKAWRKQGTLPLYISGSYQFESAYIGGCRCIMIIPKTELATVPALKKQISKIQAVDDVPVVLKLSSISAYRRKSLIENRIPFITPKQLFLPFFGAILTDEKEMVQTSIEKFMISTQQLFLYFIYSKKSELYISEATEQLPFSAMTVSRAVRQLEATGLFEVRKEGVNKIIRSDISRMELFGKAEKYLSSPVRRSGYIEKAQITPDMVPAGENVLSSMTMLNPGRVITYAVYEKQFEKNLLMDELVDPDSQVRLELWMYDPRQFSADHMADDISVGLSFMGSTDERIEEAVETLFRGQLED